MNDKFFTQKHCDRCNAVLKVRTMSWFTEETICMLCKDEEQKIRASLPNHGASYEGCGYVPDLQTQEGDGESSFLVNK